MMKSCKALSTLCVYLSTRIFGSLQKPGRKLPNDKISILSPSSQAKNKIKPLCQAHFCCNHIRLSGVNGGEDGLLPCCFSAVQLPVTARAGERKPVVGEAAQHCSPGLLTTSSSPKSTSPSLLSTNKVSVRQLLVPSLGGNWGRTQLNPTPVKFRQGVGAP